MAIIQFSSSSEREREMAMAVVSVPGPHSLQSFQFSYGTQLHGSRTLKGRPLKPANLFSSSSSSTRCSASVVEEVPPPPPPDDSLAVQSDSAIEDVNKLPLRYLHVFRLIY